MSIRRLHALLRRMRLMHMRHAISCNLKKKILTAVLFSLAVSLVVLTLSLTVGYEIVAHYYRADVEYKRLSELAVVFQNYVRTNNLSSFDTEKFAEWGDSRHVHLIFPAVRGGDEFEHKGSGKEKSAWRRTAFTVQMERTTKFADGERKTIFVYIPPRPLRTLWLVVSLFLFFIVFDLILSAFLNRKLSYILTISKGVEIFESGNLEHRIPVSGEDELGRLAASLNAMSQAIRDRILSEQRATQASREIIGDLSHDIRTPLTVGLTYLGMTLENDNLEEEERRRYLALVLKKMEQIRERTGELLDFATLYSGQQPVSKRPVEARTLADQLKEELAALGPLECDDTLPAGTMICGDAALLERLFDNLLSNIRKYGDKTHPTALRVWLEDGELRIEIRNAVDPEVEVMEDGKSLGLKICASIIEVHEGRFESSEDDDGYRVLMTIPVKDSPYRGS